MNVGDGDSSFWQWLFGVCNTALFAIFSYTHYRIGNVEQEGKKSAAEALIKQEKEIDKVWETLSLVQRDFRGVATKDDLRDMEKRIMEAIRNA